MPEKTLTIYTSTDNPKKKLKAPTQILLTLTPVDQSKLFKAHTPVAWKVLTFPPGGDIQKSVKLHTGVGFSSVSITEDDIIRPGIDITIQPRHVAPLEHVAGTLMWNNPLPLNIPGEIIAARNASGVPKSFALCTVDDYENKYEILVHLGTTPNDQVVEVGLPVMLQAYAVANYKEGKLLSVENQSDYLFSSWKNEPQPIDITGFSKNAVFHLYSDNTGKIKLDNQS